MDREFFIDERYTKVSTKSLYIELIMRFERLHRLFLEVLKVKMELKGVKDLNNVQTFILYNIGKAELAVGDITNRGYYLGSNVSYNLKRMVSNGYVVHKKSPNDKRSVYVSLSAKGKAIFGKLEALFDAHVASLQHNSISIKDIELMLKTSHNLEALLSHDLLHSTRHIF